MLICPDQTGFLVMTEDGSVLASGGELENSEATANIIANLVNLTENIDSTNLPPHGCRKISIVFEEYSYVICLSNKKIMVAKRKFPAINSSNNKNGSNVDLLS